MWHNTMHKKNVRLENRTSNKTKIQRKNENNVKSLMFNTKPKGQII